MARRRIGHPPTSGQGCSSSIEERAFHGARVAEVRATLTSLPVFVRGTALAPDLRLVPSPIQSDPATPMSSLAHWEQVYKTKGPDQVSWYQAEARLSRRLIEQVAPDRSARIIDVGAGASTLVDGLLAAGYHEITVVDLSPAAFAVAQRRLGDRAATIDWRAADVLTASFAPASFDVWHDRAVFHFLTAATDRAQYVAQLRAALRPGGHALVATFAEDGPTRCSGLDVARYSPAALHGEFGDDFQMLESHRELHTTPAGAQQAFTYCLCRFEPQSRETSAS